MAEQEVVRSRAAISRIASLEGDLTRIIVERDSLAAGADTERRALTAEFRSEEAKLRAELDLAIKQLVKPGIKLSRLVSKCTKCTV